jgi:orotidine-5'-phosphate decarboxylase
MMEAACEAAGTSVDQPPKLIAVTVLTSMAREDLGRKLGIAATPA